MASYMGQGTSHINQRASYIGPRGFLYTSDDIICQPGPPYIDQRPSCVGQEGLCVGRGLPISGKGPPMS